MGWIALIRMRGEVGLKDKLEATMQRLRLQKKFVCVVVPDTKEKMGMIQHVVHYVAYGAIDPATLKELFLKRGRLTGNKPIDPAKVTDKFIEDALSGKVKDFKPFFSLHPPRGGMPRDSRQTYPRGVLGNWKEDIKTLVLAML